MPIYEYKCSDCEKIFEILTTSANREEVRCLGCQSTRVTKLVSAGTIRSGSGTSLPLAGAAGCGRKSGFS